MPLKAGRKTATRGQLGLDSGPENLDLVKPGSNYQSGPGGGYAIIKGGNDSHSCYEEKGVNVFMKVISGTEGNQTYEVRVPKTEKVELVVEFESKIESKVLKQLTGTPKGNDVVLPYGTRSRYV